MTQKWNLQDIRPANPRKRRTPENTPIEIVKKPEIVERDDAEETLSVRIVDGNKKKGRSLVVAILVFLVIVGGGVFASALMAGADITVYPRHREPNVNATFTAYRTPQVGELSYEIMTLEAEGERQVTASGKKRFNHKLKVLFSSITLNKQIQFDLLQILASNHPMGLFTRLRTLQLFRDTLPMRKEISYQELQLLKFTQTRLEKSTILALQNSRYLVSRESLSTKQSMQNRQLQ